MAQNYETFESPDEKARKGKGLMDLEGLRGLANDMRDEQAEQVFSLLREGVGSIQGGEVDLDLPYVKSSSFLPFQPQEGELVYSVQVHIEFNVSDDRVATETWSVGGEAGGIVGNIPEGIKANRETLKRKILDALALQLIGDKGKDFEVAA